MKTFKSIKSFVVIASIVAISMFSTGCATTQTPEQKQALVRNLSYAAASTGTRIALVEQPNLRPQFVQAEQQLDTLLKTGVLTGAQLHDIISSLNVKELKSDTAKIAIDSATMLYDSLVGTSINIEQQPYVLAAATGIRDAWKLVLGL